MPKIVPFASCRRRTPPRQSKCPCRGPLASKRCRRATATDRQGLITRRRAKSVDYDMDIKFHIYGSLAFKYPGSMQGQGVKGQCQELGNARDKLLIINN